MTLAESITNYAADAAPEVCALDEDAFQAIYDRTARPLWSYLLRVGGRRDIADDLLQETYCRFLARSPRNRQAMSEAETRSYLFRIATNLQRDRWRRGEHAVADDIEEPVGEISSREPDQARCMDVRRAMQKLRPRERQLLWLAYVEGMSHEELAAATGLSSLSIRLLLSRARRRASGLLRPEIIPGMKETR
jgi:RNA polymerase sigma-70 factor (ECF subfamily)